MNLRTYLSMWWLTITLLLCLAVYAAYPNEHSLLSGIVGLLLTAFFLYWVLRGGMGIAKAILVPITEDGCGREGNIPLVRITAKRNKQKKPPKAHLRFWRLFLLGAAYWNHTTTKKHSVISILSAAYPIGSGLLISLGGVRGGFFH